MRQVWEGMLTELSKVNAPSMLLEDFNYFFNKAINQYINKRYNIYDVNQQTTDDLRVLKATSILDVTKATDKDPMKALVGFGAGKSKLLDATFEVDLPSDYMHILNCVCIYKVNKNWKCYNAGDYVQFSAKRLTADSWSVVLNDYYNRPLPSRPYFYIHNVNVNNQVPTNPIEFADESKFKISIPADKVATFVAAKPSGTGYTVTRDLKTLVVNAADVLSTDTNVHRISSAPSLTEAEVAASATIAKDTSTAKIVEGGTDMNGTYNVTVNQDTYNKAAGESTPSTTLKKTTGTSGNSNFARTIQLAGGGTADAVEKETAVRYGNASKVRMEIRYGHDSTVFTLVKVFVDYIKTPQYIRLTQEQVNLTEDTSQIMEFPDYVCQEIINELTLLVMENTADPRLQTNSTVTQSIANPAQALAQPQPQAQQRG